MILRICKQNVEGQLSDLEALEAGSKELGRTKFV